MDKLMGLKAEANGSASLGVSVCVVRSSPRPAA
jgi:hypothetical protein